jgi:hypothetical protein
MKINHETRFPHPVLSTNTGDYLFGEFKIELSVTEIPFPSQVTLNYAITLTEPTLSTAIQNNSAQIGLFVTCFDSYFSDLVPLGLDPSQIAFKPGSLIGKVTIRPMIWARERLLNYPLIACHPEFGEGGINLPSGSILAISDEITMNVGREKLAQMETIFSLAEAAHLPPNKLALDLDSEKITILAASNIYQRVNALRNSQNGKAIVLNSIYLPAVMEILHNLQDSDTGGFEGKRWFKIFNAKCQHLGIEPGKNEIWEDAQKLLQMPFSEINSAEDIGDH